MIYHEFPGIIRNSNNIGRPQKILTKIDEHRRTSISPKLIGIIPGVSPGFKNVETRSKNTISVRSKIDFCWVPKSIPDDRASLNWMKYGSPARFNNCFRHEKILISADPLGATQLWELIYLTSSFQISRYLASDIGTLGYIRINGTLGYWDLGILGPWDLGT